MSRQTRLAQNPRLLFWTKAFMEVKLLNAIIALFYLARGVTFEQIFYLTIVFSIGQLIFEIPSGYMADRIGRKRVLFVGVLATIIFQILSFTATGFWMFVPIFLLMAFADSCFSGTEEALAYDSLKEIGKEGEMTKFYGQLSSARHAAKIFFPSIGALIATQLLEWQFDLLIGVNLAFAVLSLICLIRIIEPKHDVSLEEEETGVYLQSLQTISKEPFLLRASLNKVLVFIASVIAWRVYQPYLAELNFSILWLSLFYFVMHSVGFAGKWYAHVIERRFPILFLLNGLVALMAVCAGASLLRDVPWLVAVALLLFIILENARAPFFAHAMNQRIKSKSRATTLSNLNILKSVVEIPLLFLTAYVGAFGTGTPMWVALGICVFVLIFLRFKKSDFEVKFIK